MVLRARCIALVGVIEASHIGPGRGDQVRRIADYKPENNDGHEPGYNNNNSHEDEDNNNAEH